MYFASIHFPVGMFYTIKRHHWTRIEYYCSKTFFIQSESCKYQFVRSSQVFFVPRSSDDVCHNDVITVL